MTSDNPRMPAIVLVLASAFAALVLLAVGCAVGSIVLGSC